MRARIFISLLLPLFFSAPVAAQENKTEELASVAILPYEDKTGTENFGYLPGSLVDAIDTSMRDGFTYKRISPEDVSKALKTLPGQETSSTEAVRLIANELKADIIIFGHFDYNEADKQVTIYTNIYFPTIGEVSNLEPITNPVDSTLFQVTEKVAEQIIEAIDKIVSSHEKVGAQIESEEKKESAAGKQKVTVAALETHGQHWSLGIEVKAAYGLDPKISLFNGTPDVIFLAIPVEKKIGKNLSIYNASGVGFSLNKTPMTTIIKFPVFSVISLPLFFFFPDKLLPLIDGLMFHINFLNGGSMNPYIGIPVYVLFETARTYGDICAEAGIKTKFNLGPNNYFFINGGFSYSLISLFSNNQFSGVPPILELSLGWSYLFR